MRRFFLVLTESLLLFVIGMLAGTMRYHDYLWSDIFQDRGWMKLVLMTVVIQLTFYLFDLYDLPATRRFRRVFGNLIKALCVSTLLLSILFYAFPKLAIDRSIFLIAVIIDFAVITGWRLVVAWGSGHPNLGIRERVLILGSGTQAVETARATLERRNAGIHVVGFVDNKPELVGKSLINPSVIGITEDISSLVDRFDVDRIVVALEDRRGTGVFPTEELLNLSLSGRVAVEECACYYERLTGKIATELLRPSWLIFSRGNRLTDIAYHLRRVLNLSLALLGFVVSLPIMIGVAIAVKLESRGPIFYTQERVGKNGKSFKIIKFRSMDVTAEKDTGPVWAGKSDPRVTRIGRVLRKLRLDELPQFINVIRGDMNFVGPRPERPVFVEQLSEVIPYYQQRHLIKPGLTGWAQIKFPYASSVEDTFEKLRYDLYYIKNRSFLLDAIIIFETVKTVLFGRGGQ
jgi:sugar transferase (PEP-CTERM system associated)